MGYTTRFSGRFDLDRPLDDETFTFLVKFNNTRRMARKVDKKHGVEGEFYVDGTCFRGQHDDPSVINHNRPPRTQPGLWCQWKPTDDKKGIEWDGGEKFYDYIEWLVYIIKNFLAAKKYILDGKVRWEGEDPADTGTITVINNEIKIEHDVHAIIASGP